MADNQYRTRTGAELLDAAFQLVKMNYLSFITITAIGFLPTFLLTIGTVSANHSPSLFALWMAIFGILSFVATLYMFNALIRAASDAYQGIPIHLPTVFRSGRGKIWDLFILNIIWGALLLVGFILLIVPGFIVAALLFVSPVLVVLEDLSPIPAVKRSAELCKNHKLRIVGFAAAIFVVLVISGVVAGAVGFMTHSFVVRQLISTVFNLLILPILPALMVVQYYDARIEQEGYDVERLAQQGAPVATPGMALE